MSTIVITGASSGIGKATAKYSAKEGWMVAATMRSPQNETELNQMEGVSLYQLDVTDETSVCKAVRNILADYEKVDALLNNAGYGLGASTAEFLVEGIYKATTDGSDRLRYLIGPDAEQMYAQRVEAGDDAFIAGMKQNTLA